MLICMYIHRYTYAYSHAQYYTQINILYTDILFYCTQAQVYRHMHVHPYAHKREYSYSGLHAHTRPSLSLHMAGETNVPHSGTGTTARLLPHMHTFIMQ